MEGDGRKSEIVFKLEAKPETNDVFQGWKKGILRIRGMIIVYQESKR